MRLGMTKFTERVRIGVVVLVMAVLVLAAGGNPAQSQSQTQPAGSANDQSGKTVYVVTPVFGSSWLKQLGVFDIRLSPMGEMGSVGPPPPSPRVEPFFPVEGGPPGGGMGMGMGGMMGRNYAPLRLSSSEIESLLGEKFLLAGSDFYRLDCRSCHGANGKGSPPVINALIGPFQGTSAALIEERMKKLGRPIGEQMARELASQAEQNILQRLQKGGKRMPAFRHLEGEEVTALMQYIKARVGVPESQGREILVAESVARVGEHLVKGTCKICHDATGPGMRGMGMMQGIIPSLASIPWEQSMQGVVWQVQWGSRNMMRMGGQRMPAYSYITTEEASAAFLYLVAYPPY